VLIVQEELPSESESWIREHGFPRTDSVLPDSDDEFRVLLRSPFDRPGLGRTDVLVWDLPGVDVRDDAEGFLNGFEIKVTRDDGLGVDVGDPSELDEDGLLSHVGGDLRRERREKEVSEGLTSTGGRRNGTHSLSDLGLPPQLLLVSVDRSDPSLKKFVAGVENDLSVFGSEFSFLDLMSEEVSKSAKESDGEKKRKRRLTI